MILALALFLMSVVRAPSRMNPKMPEVSRMAPSEIARMLIFSRDLVYMIVCPARLAAPQRSRWLFADDTARRGAGESGKLLAGE